MFSSNRCKQQVSQRFRQQQCIIHRITLFPFFSKQIYQTSNRSKRSEKSTDKTTINNLSSSDDRKSSTQKDSTVDKKEEEKKGTLSESADSSPSDSEHDSSDS
ncbi:MAG: hypothetical protein EZS28_028036, partial [Streblomastix strix]